MIQLTFTEAEKQALAYERYHHPHPQVQRKMETLWLKSQELPHALICQLAGISASTLSRYLRTYQAGGLEALQEVRFRRNVSALDAQAPSLEAHFRAHPPRTVKAAKADLETLTGIQRSPGRVRAFLYRLGLRRRKVGMIPAKADPEEQARFLEEDLQPRLKEAQAGRREVFFVDAAHFVQGPLLGFIWCFARRLLPAPAGRQRFNVLGALNAVTHELLTVTNDTYIEASCVAELLWQVAFLALEKPVTLVMDNARYQHCALIQEMADTLQIELLFLPTYSPNLNLIERLWRWVKKDCLRSQYYPTFEQMKQAITYSLEQAQTTRKKELDSLLTLRFQTFAKIAS